MEDIMETKQLNLSEFVELVTMDKVDSLNKEFTELTSNPTKYTQEEFIAKIKGIADRKESLVRDALKTCIKSTKVETVKITTTNYEFKVGEDIFTSISEVRTVSTSGGDTVKDSTGNFKAGDKVQLKFKDALSEIYTVKDNGKLDLAGNEYSASQVTGRFVEKNGGKVTTIVNGSGAVTYKINGLSYNGWSKIG